MHGERRASGFEEIAAWLEQQVRRVRALEAENRELRRQLDELRRGIGVAVMIEGRAFPLAPHHNEYQAAPQRDVAAASPAPSQLPPGLIPVVPADFGASAPGLPEHAAYGQSAHSPERHSFGPLASSPDQLPPMGQLAAATTHTWLESGAPWPDTSPMRRVTPPVPVRATVTHPPASGAQPSHPLWEQSQPQQSGTNPYADSYILS